MILVETDKEIVAEKKIMKKCVPDQKIPDSSTRDPSQKMRPVEVSILTKSRSKRPYMTRDTAEKPSEDEGLPRLDADFQGFPR